MDSVSLKIIDILLSDIILFYDTEDLEPRVNAEFSFCVTSSADAILNKPKKDFLDNLLDEQLEKQIEQVEFNIKRFSLYNEIEKIKSGEIDRETLKNKVEFLRGMKTREFVLTLLLTMLRNTPKKV